MSETTVKEEQQNKAPDRPPRNEDDRRPRGPGGGGRFRKKVCRFCANKDLVIDYKNTDVLVRLVSNKGKILPRRLTGTCANHQRLVAKAIKRSRQFGLMPFSVR
jgi:small subunit ribosomal protein S18